jgi:hypothetical protein
MEASIFGFDDAPQADLTDFASQEHEIGPNLSSIGQDDHKSTPLEDSGAYYDLIKCFDDLGLPGPMTVHSPRQGFLNEGAQSSIYTGTLLESWTNCGIETPMEEVAVKQPPLKESRNGQLDFTSAMTR